MLVDREANAMSVGSFSDFEPRPGEVRFSLDSVAKHPLMRIANHDSVGGDGIGGSGA